MKSKIMRFGAAVIMLSILTAGISRAEEGMWIPLLLKKYKIEDMQKAGFKLTAEDVYSVNQACLKDAIVHFGGGCTAEVISADGLILTNHHCGYGQIQRHSSVEHDYLTDGFWATTRDEELPNPGLTATFLIRIEDVTDQVLSGITSSTDREERSRIIRDNMRKVQEESVSGTHYSARVASFFEGSQYFLFVNEVFRDVRLVGAPPSAIGKFGGETDNWIWPRHTGDFSLFRIYAGPDNQPAAYSDQNVPYKPKKHLPISMKGVDEGDFTMVFGYPGRTTEYVPSFVIANQANVTIPASVDLRTKRLDIMMAAMETSPLIRIQYSAKKSGIANGWKKNQGILLGLKRINAIERKEKFEKEFNKWVQSDPERIRKYGNLLSRYNELVEKQTPYDLAMTYAREAGQAAEIIGFAGSFSSLIQLWNDGKKDEANQLAERLLGQTERFYKDYDPPTDQKIMATLLRAYVVGMTPEFLPDYLIAVNERYKGDFDLFASQLFSESPFASQQKLSEGLNNLNKKFIRILEQDPALLLSQSIGKLMVESIQPGLEEGRDEIPYLQSLYMQAQMEMQPEKLFYPDANSTIRVTYGKVSGFSPQDGVKYKHYTTLHGIIQKDNPDIYDYRVPEKLKELYSNRDYGVYGNNGEMPVCFIASNHTSGGNSGSPVINADGHLIGINFDRNWEGTMSDLMYDPDLCRNISVDIRYILFIIDKFAGAGHLIREMELVY